MVYISNNISYCFHHIIVSSNWCYSRTLNLISTFYYSIKQILCTHFLWIYTCSTFPCQRAAVVSCCTLHSPFLDVPLLLRCIYFVVDLCFSKTMISSERCRLLWPYLYYLFLGILCLFNCVFMLWYCRRWSWSYDS